MAHDVLRDNIEPVVARDKVILSPQFALEPSLLRIIEFRLFDKVVEIVVEVGVVEMKLRRTVLVVKRHRRAILDRLLEVVNGDVVAEEIPSPLLANNEWRAGE